MARITDYASLKTAITAQAFGNTTLDTALAVQLAEAKLNRRLRAREMVAVTTGSITGATAALPADFLGVRALRLTSGAFTKLEPVTIDQMDELKARADVSGAPETYAVTGANVEVYPEPASATPYRLTYYQQIPALSDAAPTNWLLLAHPDVYLCAGMVEVGLFLDDDAVLNKYTPMLVALVDDLNRQAVAAQYGDRLTPRTGVAVA